MSVYEKMPKFSEKVEIQDLTATNTRITLDGDNTNIAMTDRLGNDAIALNGAWNQILMVDNAKRASIVVDGSRGEINLHDAKAATYPTVRLNGEAGIVGVGGHGKGGIIRIDNSKSDISIYLNGANGSMDLFDEDGKRSLAVRGKYFDNKTVGMWIGAAVSDPGPKAGVITIRDTKGGDSIILDGAKGDIFLNNADCAEDFDIFNSEETEPGTVVVIEQEGKLRQCTIPYDKRVAGVISGAGDCKPGIVLDKKYSHPNRQSISLMGKVHCKVEATHSPIEVGDLLTTSAISGYAMKATDPFRAFGAVIGKALRPLKAGQGLIPILIALQ